MDSQSLRYAEVLAGLACKLSGDPPRRQTLGRAGRATRFAQGEAEVGGSAVLRNLPDAPLSV